MVEENTAICESLKKSSKIEKFFAFLAMLEHQNIAENIILDLDNFENIKNFIIERKN